jgi:spore coat polysaccharide biosynthesis predicted glycosyltransferase SpsG
LLQNRTNNPVAIITSFGKELGNGHIQRMLSLLWFLNLRKNINAFLLSEKIPDFIPAHLQKYIKKNIDFTPGLIIRDMRDSSEDEIMKLKKTAKVIVIDDLGPGKRLADIAIDILPNPCETDNQNSSRIFIYGYNFISAVSDLKNKIINKDLDFALYPGNSPHSEYIEFLISLLPDKSDYAILNGKDSYLVKNGKKIAAHDISYADIILSSKVVISHFGITLYEGAISGCRLISINPTEYHSNLSEIAEKFLPLANFGVSSDIDKLKARTLIRKAVNYPSYDSVNSQDVYNGIITCLENFYKLIGNLA